MSLPSRLLAGCVACSLSIAALPALAQISPALTDTTGGGFIRVNNQADYLRAQRHYQDELRQQRLHEQNVQEQNVRDERVRQERLYEQQMNNGR